MTKRKVASKIRVLFVCTGNTCRSAMAESIFRQRMEEPDIKRAFAVSSAGICARLGDKMNDEAKSALRARGIKPHRHKARVLTNALIARATLIVCMTDEHKTAVNSNKAISIGEITERGSLLDPYGRGADEYAAAVDYLLSAMDNILIKAKSFAEKINIKK